MEILRAPYLGTAEDEVLLGEWLLGEGDAFKKGQALATLETIKATFELEAERDGVLIRRLVPEGAAVRAQAALGVLGDAGERIDEARLQELVVEAEAEPVAEPAAEPAARGGPPVVAPAEPADVAAAPAARRLAAERGIDLTGVRGTGPGGLIRVGDVEAASDGASRDGAEPGRLDPEFLDYLARDGDAFAALSSEFKAALYRKHGAILGRGVFIGAGSVIRAERLVLGDGSRIGDGCRVDASDFRAGELLHLGPRTVVKCRRVLLGDNAFFAPDVEIGGGGAMDPEAELVVGSHGFVGEHVHLNPCRPLVLGDEVVVSRNAVLMTHSFGASVLDGYPNRFDGIRIGDRCQIGIHCSLFPGVTMGEGSILLSGSSLVTDVPPGRLYGGVPAKDLKAAARPLSPADAVDCARTLVLEFGRQLELRGLEVAVVDEAPCVEVTVRRDGAVNRLRFAPNYSYDADAAATEDVRVCARIPEETWADVPADVVAVDLSVPRIRGACGPLAAAFREFLRKRGVRLHPRSWTYPGGWL